MVRQRLGHSGPKLWPRKALFQQTGRALLRCQLQAAALEVMSAAGDLSLSGKQVGGRRRLLLDFLRSEAAKPLESQGAVMLPAHAAPWLQQRPRPPGEEALYKYPMRPSGVPPRKRALVVWKPPRSRSAVPLEHVPLFCSPASPSHALHTLACSTIPPPYAHDPD